MPFRENIRLVGRKGVPVSRVGYHPYPSERASMDIWLSGRERVRALTGLRLRG